MIRFLSGKTHEVVTGISIVKANSTTKIIDYEKTLAKIQKLSNEKIETISVLKNMWTKLEPMVSRNWRIIG